MLTPPASSVPPSIPGTVWSLGPFSILRVTARRFTDNDHFVLLRNCVPIATLFSTCTAAIRYAEHEWLEGAPVVS